MYSLRNSELEIFNTGSEYRNALLKLKLSLG